MKKGAKIKKNTLMNKETKIILLALILSMPINQTCLAQMTTEKDIGKCTHYNAMGFCTQSATHYCASFASNWRCQMWYAKSKGSYTNALEQFNAFNNDLQKAIENQGNTKTLNNTQTNTLNTQNIKNTEKPQIKKQEEEQKKFLAAEKAAIPNSVKLSETIKETDKKIQALQAKQMAGIDVSDELELLKYKSYKLWELKSPRTKYATAYDNFKNGIISQTEFDEIVKNLTKEDIEIATPYMQIMSITVTSMRKEQEEQKAEKEAAEKKERKIKAGKKLIQHGTLYVPPAASNWIRHGVDTLELFK